MMSLILLIFIDRRFIPVFISFSILVDKEGVLVSLLLIGNADHLVCVVLMRISFLSVGGFITLCLNFIIIPFVRSAVDRSLLENILKTHCNLSCYMFYNWNHFISVLGATNLHFFVIFLPLLSFLLNEIELCTLNWPVFRGGS